MGYEGKGLGKQQQRIIEPIKLVMRSKSEGLGYERGKNVIANLNQGRKDMYCSHCNKHGHEKKLCWDIYPCRLCGLRNHSKKMCWNKMRRRKPMTGYEQMDYGWIDGEKWKHVTCVLRRLYRWKNSYVEGKEGSRWRERKPYTEHRGV